MIPLIRRLIHALLWDELAAVRWLRGSMLLFATGGATFADQIAATIGAPKSVMAIRVAALCCGFLGGAITAGQRNPKPGATP